MADKSLYFGVMTRAFDFAVDLVDRDKGEQKTFKCFAEKTDSSNTSWAIGISEDSHEGENDEDKESIDFCIASAIIFLFDNGARKIDLRGVKNVIGQITLTLMDFSVDEVSEKVYRFSKNPMNLITAHINSQLEKKEKEGKTSKLIDASPKITGKMSPRGYWNLSDGTSITSTSTWQFNDRELRDFIIELRQNATDAAPPAGPVMGTIDDIVRVVEDDADDDIEENHDA